MLAIKQSCALSHDEHGIVQGGALVLLVISRAISASAASLGEGKLPGARWSAASHVLFQAKGHRGKVLHSAAPTACTHA